MASPLVQSYKSFQPYRWLLLGLGALVLAILWWAIFISEGFFTEAHLASYYCCLTPAELQKIGGLERIVSDFFRTSPGRELPGLFFVLATSVLCLSALAKSPSPVMMVFGFVLISLGYLVADYVLVGLSWLVSNWLMGPQTSAYRGYERTWYGIVAHATLWLVFFYSMLKFNRMMLNVRL